IITNDMLAGDAASCILPGFFPHLQETVERIEYEPAPDQYICYFVDICKCLIIHEHPDEQHDSRRKILQETDQRQPYPLGAQRKQQERDRRRNTCAHHDQAVDVESEIPLPTAFQKDYEDQCKRGQYERLNCQCKNGIQVDHFLDQTVNTERCRKVERNPRSRSETCGKICDSREYDDDCHPLDSGETLTEQRKTKQYADQRVDIIAQTCVKNMTGVHRNDIDQPV